MKHVRKYFNTKTMIDIYYTFLSFTFNLWFRVLGSR